MKCLRFGILALVIGISVVACGPTRSTSSGSLRAAVQLRGLRAGTVAQVSVAITSSDPAAPAIAPLVLSAIQGEVQTYGGTFPQLRATTGGSPTYRLDATATDTIGLVLYAGSALGVKVLEGKEGLVIIIANSTAPVVETEYVPVRITAVEAGSLVRSGEKLTFKITFNADATSPKVVSWVQAGVADASTVFSDPAKEDTTWTAPTTTIFLTEHITVSVSNGLGAPSSVTFDVNVSAKVDAPIEVVLNDAPVLVAMGLSAPRVSPGGSVVLTVTATDVNGDTLSYAFGQGTCTGALAAGLTPEVATFTAGAPLGSCQLTVTVSDGHGLSAVGKVTLDVDPAPPARVFVVTPTAPLTLNNVVGVNGDPAPADFLGSGSIAASGVPKSEIYFPPLSLFGHKVLLGEVAAVSYWTKKATTHVVDAHDWYLAIYTTPQAGQTSGWYGVRIGAEAYLARNLAENAGAWNLWSTAAGNNQLGFFESTYGYFGSYADPTLADFVAGTSLAGARGPSAPYAAQEILYFTVQTASSAPGFTGQLDGLRIELKDGAVVIVDFEP